MDLTEDEKTALIDSFAPRDCKNGASHFEFCKVCGSPQWVSTDTAKPREATASTSWDPCGRCQDVVRRAPEVVNWILAVMSWRDRMRSKEPSS